MVQDYNSNKKVFNSLNLDFYIVEKLQQGLVMLKITESDISEKNYEFLVRAIDLLNLDGNNNIIIDFRNVNVLKTNLLKVLHEKFTDINESNGSVRFLVDEDKPIISYTARKYFEEYGVFISLNKAIKDYREKAA